MVSHVGARRLNVRALGLVAVFLMAMMIAPNSALAAPVTTVYVSSLDGLVRQVIVSGPGKSTATVVGKNPVTRASGLLFEPGGATMLVAGGGYPDIYRLDPNAPGGA